MKNLFLFLLAQVFLINTAVSQEAEVSDSIRSWQEGKVDRVIIDFEPHLLFPFGEEKLELKGFRVLDGKAWFETKLTTNGHSVFSDIYLTPLDDVIEVIGYLKISELEGSFPLLKNRYKKYQKQFQGGRGFTFQEKFVSLVGESDLIFSTLEFNVSRLEKEGELRLKSSKVSLRRVKLKN